MRVNIGMPVVRTDGRSVGHVITKCSVMGRFIYPWCSAGAFRARSSATKTVDGVFRVLCLATQPLDFQCYFLFTDLPPVPLKVDFH